MLELRANNAELAIAHDHHSNGCAGCTKSNETPCLPCACSTSAHGSTMSALPAAPASRTDFFARHGDHAIIVAVPADVADEAVHAVFRECGWPLEHFAEITRERASKKQTRAFKATFLLRRDMQACAAHLRKHKPWGPDAQVRESGFTDAGGSLHHSAVLSHNKCVALLNHAVGPLAWSNTITDLRRRVAPPIKPRPAAHADGGVSASELGLFCMAKATLMAGMPADALDEETEEEVVLARLIAEHGDDFFADPPPVAAAAIIPAGDSGAEGDGGAALVGEDGDVYGAGGDTGDDDDDGDDSRGGDDTRAPTMITSGAPVTAPVAHSAGAAVAAALGAEAASAAARRDAAGGSVGSAAGGGSSGVDHRVIAIDDGDEAEADDAGDAASGQWPIRAPAIDGRATGSTWLINGVRAIPAPPPGPCCFKSPYVLPQGRSLMPTKKKPVGKHPVQMVGQGTGICIHVRTCITIHNAASDAPGDAEGDVDACAGPAFPTVTSVGAGGCTCCAVLSRERRDAVIAACTVDHNPDAAYGDGDASLHPYRFSNEDVEEHEEPDDRAPLESRDDGRAEPSHGRAVAISIDDEDDDDDEKMRSLRQAAAAAAVALHADVVDDVDGADVDGNDASDSMRRAAAAGRPSPATAARTAGKCFEAFVEHTNVTAGYRVGEGAAAGTGKSRGKPTPTGAAAAAHLTSKYREAAFTRQQQEEGMPMMRATNDALRAACANIHLLLRSPA